MKLKELLLYSNIILLPSYNLLAQQIKIIKLIPEPINLSNRNFYIDSIVDVRLNKTNIGEAQMGLFNKRVKANLEGDFVITLTQFFKSSLPKPNTPSKRIILVVNHLMIDEKTYSMKEVGLAETGLVFCILDSGKLKKVFEYDSKSENGGMDVTGGHSKRIKECFLNSINAFASSDWKTRQSEIYKGQPVNTLTKDEHILYTTERRRGIYKNFEELVSNSPSINIPFKVINKNKFTFIEDMNLSNRIKGYYGFCDGSNLYINTLDYNASDGKHFAKLIEEGRYCLFLDHYVGGGEQIASQVAFGLVGSALAKSGWDNIVLDMKTGEIFPLYDDTMKKILKEDLEYYDEYLNLSEGKTDLKIQLGLIKKFNARNPLFKY